MSYAIMRTAKLRGAGSVAAALQHSYRERPTPNADPERAHLNVNFDSQRVAEAMGKMNRLLPASRRKDAVLAVEYVLAASPEFFEGKKPEDIREWAAASVGWVKEKYGADRVISTRLHMDETSPHVSMFVVPLTKDGRLSAKDFIGNKTLMTADQTSYAKAMAKFGLKRGQEKSQAKHTTIKAFYEKVKGPGITAQDLAPRIKKKGLLSNSYEDAQDVADRLNGRSAAIYKAMKAKIDQEAAAIDVEKKKLAQERKELARKIDEVEKFGRFQKNLFDMWSKVTDGFTKESRTEFVKVLEDLRPVILEEQAKKSQEKGPRQPSRSGPER